MCPIKHRPISFCFLQPRYFVPPALVQTTAGWEFLHTLKQEHLYLLDGVCLLSFWEWGGGEEENAVSMAWWRARWHAQGHPAMDRMVAAPGSQLSPVLWGL